MLIKKEEPALCRKGIKTFIDSKGLHAGDKISSLFETIEGSKLFLVIFSKDYASSIWCLEELAKIVGCKKTTGTSIIPVFYDVDPAQVRYQTGRFREAFEKHELREPKEKLQIWRSSLIQASNLSGWDSRVTRPESELIDKIVEDILHKLGQQSSTYFHGLVGIDSRVNKVESLLCLDSPTVRSVGIWGMGGIGKTTLARAVFNHLYKNFEGSCFLENVREELNLHGKVALQNKFLSSVLDEKSVYTGSLSLTFTLERLRIKRIFVVFDDVDDSTLHQLQDLVRHHDLFGHGSKVLFTGRDVQVLKNFGVDEIYQVDELDQDEALQLFVSTAFKNMHPRIDYLEKSKRVVNYTGGHPLAIKVLASTLLGRRKEDWITILDKLEKLPKPRIMNILRISYDKLTFDERSIFLDIAFFFKGKNEDYVKQILDNCYGHVHLCIARLVENALITISTNNKIEMHDLLQEMSFCIVHEESIKDPGKRSRLLDPNDVHKVLAKKKGTDAVEGISLDLSKAKHMQLETDAFAAMTQLRILKFYNDDEEAKRHSLFSNYHKEVKVQLPSCGLGYLSDELRLLHWEGFPSKFLPSNFCWEHIVDLQMAGSQVKRLWTGTQHLMNLRFLNLKRCRNLIEIPDLSYSKNIESIDLSWCRNLLALHSSIQYLNKLQFLNIQSCPELRKFPRKLNSKCLRILKLKGCSKLQKFPDFFSDNLEFLSFDYLPSTSEVPSFQNFKHLKVLQITNCSHMITKFPDNISNSIQHLDLCGSGIEEIPSSIQSLQSLSWLELNDNKYLSTLPTTIWKLRSLTLLDLRNCPKLEEFPEMKEPMENLRSLTLSGCENLKKLPTNIINMTSLTFLWLDGCKSIRFVPKLPRSLSYLQADNCESLETESSSSSCNLEDWSFMNCCRLNRKTREEILAIVQSRIKGNDEVKLCLPGNEIPKWFDFWSMGASMTVPLPFSNNHVAGITFCIVYQCTCPYFDMIIRVRLNFHDKDNDSVIFSDDGFCFKVNDETKSDHMILWHPSTDQFNACFPAEEVLSDSSALSLEFSVEETFQSSVHGDHNVLLKECAVHLHFAQDSAGSNGDDFLGDLSALSFALSSDMKALSSYMWNKALRDCSHKFSLELLPELEGDASVKESEVHQHFAEDSAGSNSDDFLGDLSALSFALSSDMWNKALSDCSHKFSLELLPELEGDASVKESEVHQHFAEDSDNHDEGYYSSNDEAYYSCNDEEDFWEKMPEDSKEEEPPAN